MLPSRPQVTAGAAGSPGYSPSRSQRPRRGRSRKPGAMVRRAPAVPAPCRALSPLETRRGAGARERPRPAHCGSHAPLLRAEAGRRHLRLEPQLGLEGRLLEWAWRVSRSFDPQLSLRAGFRSSILWSAWETASCPVSEWWGQTALL